MKWGILATGTIAKKFASTVEQMGAEGEQLLHLFAAADQRNACVVDGGDQIATVLTDIKLCLHIQILHRNVVSVSCDHMITFPS